MASYYHDARAHARKLKEMSEDNKRRAERKAEIAETQVNTARAEQNASYSSIAADLRCCRSSTL